ncbi:MAG: hypothetical protein CL609_14240 [Anaerolineaceae bacterium]|nr:hypothetical protein [Anaerolineaceae bacterium]
MLRITNHKNNLRFSCAVLFVILLLTACSPTPTASVSPQPETIETLPSVSSPESTADLPTSESATGPENLTVSLDLNGIGQNFTTEVIDTSSVDKENAPYWEILPQYTVLTISGYPITNHLMKPQIFIYPVNELKNTNEEAGKIANNLQALLKSQEPGENLPFLPMFNAAQVMSAQVKFMDFQNGQGVRFITQFDQAPLPINNYELIYTYQGLTKDGLYYVAAVLPVNLSGLPADQQITDQDPTDFVNNFPAYLENTIQTINQQAAGDFSPTLTSLDEMIQSIEIKQK